MHICAGQTSSWQQWIGPSANSPQCLSQNSLGRWTGWSAANRLRDCRRFAADLLPMKFCAKGNAMMDQLQPFVRLKGLNDPIRSSHLNPELTSLPDMPLVIAKQAVDYIIDFAQRSVLFTDVLRQRGNQYYENLAEHAPHVLNYDVQLVIDGRTLKRPVNYVLEIGRAHV